jgi:hypothetical protein
MAEQLKDADSEFYRLVFGTAGTPDEVRRWYDEQREEYLADLEHARTCPACRTRPSGDEEEQIDELHRQGGDYRTSCGCCGAELLVTGFPVNCSIGWMLEWVGNAKRGPGDPEAGGLGG